MNPNFPPCFARVKFCAINVAHAEGMGFRLILPDGRIGRFLLSHEDAERFALDTLKELGAYEERESCKSFQAFLKEVGDQSQIRSETPSSDGLESNGHEN
jgi:hypothetical protein